MGIFSNKKKLCPICGSPTPRLLATKVEDTPICDNCFQKIDLPSGALDRMNLQRFQQYIDFYDANEPLRKKFHVDFSYNVAGMKEQIDLDLSNKLFRLCCFDSGLVMEGAQLKSFRITQDGKALFEGGPAGLTVHDNDVPGRIQQMAPAIENYRRELREYERMKDMARLTPDESDDEFLRRYPRPRLHAAEPVQKFRVSLTIDHPYWTNFQGEVNAPDLNTFSPSAESYLTDYEEAFRKLEALANHLISFIAPGAPVNHGGASAAPAAAPQAAAAPASDPIAEIQRYKGLLDAGILTEEEFAAKKRQLLGL